MQVRDCLAIAKFLVLYMLLSYKKSTNVVGELNERDTTLAIAG